MLVTSVRHRVRALDSWQLFCSERGLANRYQNGDSEGVGKACVGNPRDSCCSVKNFEDVTCNSLGDGSPRIAMLVTVFVLTFMDFDVGGFELSHRLRT